MYCSQCGAPLPDDGQFCNRCGASTAAFEPVPVSRPRLRPALVARRLGALALDGAIVSAIQFFVMFVLLGPLFRSMFHYELGDDVRSIWRSLPPETRVSIGLLFLFVFAGVPWLYNAVFESSARQGTLAKGWLGVRIVDRQGSRISFLRATARYLAKVISLGLWLPALISLALLAFDDESRTLHDRIAGTRAVRRDHG